MMLDATTKLLDDFRALPDRVERPQTFMEIAGYPHYENVCSNILAFFMDPEESHGLGTLVLDALASVSNIAMADKGIGGNVSVEREVNTNKSNRIDIMIESDDHAILIENKIHAGASNPFDDYVDYLDQKANGRAKHKFLLTLLPTNEGSKWSFTNLTHEELVDQIRSLLGHYVSDADARYLTMFLDFLNTLENLKEGTRMNQEFLKMLSERDADIQGLLAEVKSFQDELRQKVKHLRDLIDVGEYETVERQDIWRKGTTTLCDLVYHNIRISDNLLVAVEAIIDSHGWEINIWPWYKGDSAMLGNLLKRLDIPFDVRQGPKPFVHPARFAYDEDLEQIRPVLEGVIDKLATSQERAE